MTRIEITISDNQAIIVVDHENNAQAQIVNYKIKTMSHTISLVLSMCDFMATNKKKLSIIRTNFIRNRL